MLGKKRKVGKKSIEPIWTEGLRPSIENLVGNTVIIQDLLSFVDSLNKPNPVDIPNLILAGIEGTGKTTAAKGLGVKLGKIRRNVLIINGSIEGVKATLVGKIKQFCGTESWDNYFKVVIIDEADNMSSAMQHGLRKDIEDFKAKFNILFIFVCNYPHKIISPLKSRVAIYTFKPLSMDEMKIILERVKKRYNLEIDDNCVELVIKKSKFLPRNFIQFLQQLSISATRKVTMEIVKKFIFVEDKIKELFNMLIKNEEIDKILNWCENTLKETSMYEADIINAIHDYLIKTKKFIDKIKQLLIIRTAEADFRIAQGGSPYTQLSWLLAQYLLIFEKSGASNGRKKGNTGKKT